MTTSVRYRMMHDTFGARNFARTMPYPVKMRGKAAQFMISIGTVLIVSLFSYMISGLTGYRLVALLLLLAVSVLAMFLDIVPVMTAALLSALVWDYFFIPPHFTFHIDSTEDLLMLLMYFFIALVNATLTFKIRQRDRAIRQKEEKERAIKLYNTVLNSLSHELRTPIATILGAADGLMQPGSRLSDEGRQELIGEITAASLRLNLQVENLLNMSRLESGFIQPKKDWCDVGELVYSVVNRLDTTGHTIEVQLPERLPLFRIDLGMMHQVVHNLISNALQYTPHGSIITIGAGRNSSGLWLSVSDNGPGFPETEIEKVFEKFYRLPNAPSGGTGLGLSIVKGFVAAQGGVVSLENRLGGGARFTVEIPSDITELNMDRHEE